MVLLNSDTKQGASILLRKLCGDCTVRKRIPLGGCVCSSPSGPTLQELWCNGYVSDCNSDAEVTSVVLASGVVFSVVDAPLETVVYSYWARSDAVAISLVGSIRQPQASAVHFNSAATCAPLEAYPP